MLYDDMAINLEEITASNAKNRRKRKKSNLTMEEEEELERLENLLLKQGKSVFENADKLLLKEESEASSSENTTIKKKNSLWKVSKKQRKPAWEDSDDEGLKVDEALSSQGRPKMGVPAKPTDDYQLVLKKRFEARIGNPDWARLDRKVDNDEDLLKSCGNFIEKDSSTLLSGVLDIKKVKNVNRATSREGPFINSVQFHPTSTVALVAGSAGVASIFQVNGSSNPHLQSVKFDNFPIRCARFSQDGNQFIVGSQRYSHYFVYDMMEGRSIRVPAHHATEQTNMKKFEVSPDGKFVAVCGRFGNIHILHARTKEWLGTLKMNSEVAAVCFNSSGSQLWSIGEDGQVYTWDMSSRRCLHRFADDGCVRGVSVAVSPSGQLVACGSSSGVVNLYQTQATQQSAAPRPSRALLHLVTAVTTLQFNPTSQILAMSSDEKDGSLKLVHFPSMTVFSNFPAKESLSGRVHCHDFSPSSGYLAVGNNQHVVQLFRLNHFGNY